MSDCIEWTGWIRPDGYGYKRVKGKHQLAHRWTWEQANGPIPNGLSILHTCDNPPCVNLDHLYLGTHIDNMRDMRERGRGRGRNTNKTHCDNGHAFTDDNTYIDQLGWRHCRKCRKEASQRFRERQKKDAEST